MSWRATDGSLIAGYPIARPPVAAVRGVFARFPSVFLLPILLAYLAIPIGLGPGGRGDEVWYIAYAHHLLDGYYAPRQATGQWGWLAHGPALSLVLVPLVALHLPVLVMRCVVSAGALFLAVVVFYKLATIYVRQKTALAAAYVFACAYLPFFLLLRRVGDDALAVLLAALVAHRVALWHATQRTSDVFLAGLFLGLLALTRVEFGYLLALWLVLAGLCFLVLRKSRATARFALIACVVGLATCAPYLAYTYTATHRVFYWSDSGGAQLYWMATGRTSDLGDWHNWTEVFSNPHLAAYRPFYRTLGSMSPVARDSKLRTIALHNIARDPTLYARNLVFNAERQVLNLPYSYTPTRWRNLIFFGVPSITLIVLFLFSVARLLRRRTPHHDEMALFVVFVITTFGLHTLVAVQARMFATVVPMAAIVCVYALWQSKACLVGPRAGSRSKPRTDELSPNMHGLLRGSGESG
jgi:4-amino-4-deoxy-L-arabinose transferase-like glycosyltransferase